MKTEKPPPCRASRRVVLCARHRRRKLRLPSGCGLRNLSAMPDAASNLEHASLKKLFPGLTPEEYVRLDAWYTGYAALILRMYDRITADPEAYASFRALTDLPLGPTMKRKADSRNTSTATEA